jgi:hypothetical protein
MTRYSEDSYGLSSFLDSAAWLLSTIEGCMRLRSPFVGEMLRRSQRRKSAIDGRWDKGATIEA